MALIQKVADFAPEAIAAARRTALDAIAKDPELMRIANIFGKDVAEELIPAIAISRGKATPAQIEGLAALRLETGNEFPDVAKDLMNRKLGNVSSIRTEFSDTMPSGAFRYDDEGNIILSAQDVGGLTKMIKEMSANSLASRGVDAPFTAYRSYDDLFGWKPSTRGVLSFTETPDRMAARWMGGHRMTWQPTRISPADVTFDYGIGKGLRPEETEIQSLAKLVVPEGPRMSLAEYIAQGGAR